MMVDLSKTMHDTTDLDALTAEMLPISVSRRCGWPVSLR